jgi:hypothetical protein
MNQPNPLFRRRAALAALPFAVVVLLGAGLLLPGCDDDDDDGPPGMTNSQLTEDAFTGLLGFATRTGTGSEAQLLSHPAIGGLFQAMGISLGTFADIGALPMDVAGLTREFAGRPVSKTLLQPPPFGTYERDLAQQAEPFPGWSLVTADVPPDGFVFTFDLEDDITFTDETGTRVVAGELRFLNVVLDLVNEMVTAMTFEVQIDGETPSPLIRIAYSGVFDEQLDPVMLQIGDESDVESTYIGLLSFAIFLQVTSDAAGEDIVARLQLVDRSVSPFYVISLGLTVLDLLEVGGEEIPGALTFSLGFGETDTPTEPPLMLTTTFDNFEIDPIENELIADVNGNIVYNGNLIATFTGDTTEVPVNYDTNGDGQINAEDTCPNITMTFTGEQPANICEVLGDVIVAVELPVTRAGDNLRVGPFGF